MIRGPRDVLRRVGRVRPLPLVTGSPHHETRRRMERDPLRPRKFSPSRIAGLATLFAALSPALASAQDAAAPAVNQADTAWMLISTALVLLMTPALGFFYGGLVRSKNSLNTMMMSYIALGFVGVAWALIVFSLAFAPATTTSATSRWRCSAMSASARRAPQR